MHIMLTSKEITYERLNLKDQVSLKTKKNLSIYLSIYLIYLSIYLSSQRAEKNFSMNIMLTSKEITYERLINDK